MKAEPELPITTSAGRLADGLVAADGQAVLIAVGDARLVAGCADVIGGLVLPAVRELRRRHRCGEIDGVTLAAGTSLGRRALMRAGDAGVAPRPGQRTVVVASTDADASLEAEGAYEALVAAGHPAQLLLAVNEPDVLQRHLGNLRPLAVTAASSDSRGLPAIAALASVAGRAGIPLLATGPAFGPAGVRSARVGATAWTPDPAGMLDVLSGWQASGGALPMNVQEPAEAALIRAAWPAVVMAAAGTGGPDEVWAQATVRTLGDLLLAAMWAGDVEVLLEWLGDELAGPDRTHVRDVHLIGLLDAVSAALPPTMQAAAAMLASARDDLRQRILRPGRVLRALPEGELAHAGPSAGGAAIGIHARGAFSPGASSPLASSPLASTPLASAGLAGAPSAYPSPFDGGFPPAGTVGVGPSWLGAPGLGGVGPVSAGPLSAGPASGSPASPAPAASPTGLAAGQTISDLLLLSALSVQATAAVVAVAQPGGRWSALAHGVEVKDGLNDPQLWNAIAARREPLEISDLMMNPELSRSPLAKQPASMRWAYGTVLRNPDGTVAGVLCLLDRWIRQATRREQRALAASARQLNAQLQALRRPPPIVGDPQASVRQLSERGSRRGASLPEGQQLLRSHEVAVLFDVTERTVINWAAAGKLPSLRTIGGHLRFRSDDVHALLSSRRTGA
jgi:excisionase family DNA binding protein